MALIWGLPNDPSSLSALGGGITWAWDASMCSALTVEHAQTAATEDTTCHRLKAAMRHAFDAWSDNHPLINFKQVQDAQSAELLITAGNDTTYAAVTIFDFNEVNYYPRLTNGIVAMSPGTGRFIGGLQATVGFSSAMCWHLDSDTCYQRRECTAATGQAAPEVCSRCHDFGATAVQKVGQVLGLAQPDLGPGGSVLPTTSSSIGETLNWTMHNRALLDGRRGFDCMTPWAHVFNGRPPLSLPLELDRTTGMRPSVMLRLAPSISRAARRCITQDDFEGLHTLYPLCGAAEGQWVTPMCRVREESTSAINCPPPSIPPPGGGTSDNLGAVIGGVLGGVLAMLLVAIGVLAWRLHSRKPGGTAAARERREVQVEVAAATPANHMEHEKL